MDFDLRATARRAMAENGFIPDFPPEVHREVEALEEATPSEFPEHDQVSGDEADDEIRRRCDQRH